MVAIDRLGIAIPSFEIGIPALTPRILCLGIASSCIGPTISRFGIVISARKISISSLGIAILLLKITISDGKIAPLRAKGSVLKASFAVFVQEISVFRPGGRLTCDIGAASNALVRSQCYESLMCLTGISHLFSFTVRARAQNRKRSITMSSPKDKEVKMQQMLNAWQTLAAAKSFGGMTLAQFQAIATPFEVLSKGDAWSGLHE
jgi:hypothetical protein